MARLERVDEGSADLDPDLLATMKANRQGNLAHLDGLLLHSQVVARGWHALYVPLASDAKLDRRCRELGICRVSQMIRAAYSAHSHRELALKAGVTEAQLEALAAWHGSDLFDPRERAVLAYTEAMTADIQVPDATFEALRAHFDDREIVELTVNIAGYNMIGRFSEALGLTP